MNGGDTSAVVTVSVHSGVMFERSVKVLLSTNDQNATSGIGQWLYFGGGAAVTVPFILCRL